MKRSVFPVVATGVMGVWILSASASDALLAARADQDVLDADRAFMQALGTSDKAAVRALLDPELIWIDSEGTTKDRNEVPDHLPSSTVSDTVPTSYTYHQIATVRTDSGKQHVLRVWVKRASGWRLLVYHEVKQAEKTGPPAPPVKECINPCQTVPYQPKNDAEAGVIKSWQELETAVTAGDADRWAPHFVDEFVVIRSSGTEPETKQDRIANLKKQKQAGTNGAPGQLAPDRTRMFTVGDAAVMSCQTLPHRGKPSQVTRVWTKRNGMWLMTVSFQTTIQAAAPVEAR